jgi:hypothetical protein
MVPVPRLSIHRANFGGGPYGYARLAQRKQPRPPIQPIASSLVASTGKPCNQECRPWRIPARVIFNEDWYSQRALCRVPTGGSQVVIGSNIEDDQKSL